MPYGPNTEAVLDLLARLGSISQARIADVGHRLDGLPFGLVPKDNFGQMIRPRLEAASIRVGRAEEAERAFIDGTAILTSTITSHWVAYALEGYWNDKSSRPANAAGVLAAGLVLADQLEPWTITELKEPWRALGCRADDYFGSRTPAFRDYLAQVEQISEVEAQAWVAAWWNGPLPSSVFVPLGISVAEIKRADPHREAQAAAETLVRANVGGWLWDRVAWRARTVPRFRPDNAFMNQLGIAASGAGVAVAFGHLLPVALREELLRPYLAAVDHARWTS